MKTSSQCVRAAVTIVLALGLPPGMASAQTCVARPSGLISWWRAEGSTIDTINGNNLASGPAYVAAKVGSGFDLAPASTTGPGAPFNMQAPGFTAEFWMRGIHNQPSVSNLYLVVDKSHGGTFGNTGWAFQGESVSGRLSFISGNGTGFVGTQTTGDLLDGTFHHVAGTWDGTTLRLYVDGVLQASAALSSPQASPGALEVGNWHGQSRRFVGTLDELAIYGRALSASEIQGIVAAGVAGKCRPCGDGVVHFDEQCDDGNTVSGDCCSATCTAEAAGNACASDGIACTLDQCDTTGACTHPSNGTCPCQPRATPTVSWWPGQNTPNDVVDGNHGALVGTAAGYALAKVGNGFNFAASGGGYVNVPHNVALNMTLPGFTAEFWMKGNHTQDESLWDAMDKAHQSGGWAFQGETASGRVCFHPSGICSSGVDVLDSAFHHVATTWDGSIVRLYVDGVQRSSASQGAPVGNATALNIGRWTAGPRQFRGVIDEVTVYSRALSAGEIRAIFSAGAAGKCASPCGNGTGDAGEQCDDGNNANGDCCSASCQFESAATVCRPAAGACDAPETCTGTSATCPPDVKSTGVCRPAPEGCDVAEVCDGVGNACPPDAVLPPGSVCRVSSGGCDIPETCDGVDPRCPGDSVEPANTLCRPPAGVCDVPEFCDGVYYFCPPDLKGTTICRVAASACDVAEHCDGVANDCPADAYEGAGTVCRAAAGVCDVAETCTGSGTACPSDAKSTAVCRAVADVCDVAESCDGSGNDCPADQYVAAGQPCRAAAGDCDVTEACTGSGSGCPPDARSTDLCRVSAGPCDASEFCNGIGVSCPADFTVPDGTPCDDGDACTTADACVAGICAGAVDPYLCAGDADDDGVADTEDACPATPGFTDRQGCPVGDLNVVELHMVDQTKAGACPGNAGSCKAPVVAAEVRVFDRNASAFRAAYGTKNPSGTVYDQVFESDIARVGSCATDAEGRCIAGEEAMGDYLVIVRVVDVLANRTVYAGKPKSPSDFADTNGDAIGDLATKDFQIVKLIRRDGTIQISGGSKTVVTGSFLEIVYPDLAVWEDAASGYVYPFVFTSDSAWTVDVCASVLSGYHVVGIYDDDGTFHSSVQCVQTFVANETRAVAFEVIETGSPEPRLFTRLRVRGGHLGRSKEVRLEIPGVRRYPGQRLLDALGPACWLPVNFG